MERTSRTGTRALASALSLALAGCGAGVAPVSIAPSSVPTANVTPVVTDMASPLPTVAATPLPTALETPAWIRPGPLPAGLYGVNIGGSFLLGPVQFTFRIPDGWMGPPNPGFAVLKQGPTGEAAMILSFWWPANVYADVCDNTSLLDPPVGPTVDDLAGALANQSGTETSDPTPITIDGFRGQQVELIVRKDVADCPGSMWLWLDKDGGRRSTDGDEDSELSILDVGGERVVIYVLYRPGTPEEERAELRAVFETIQIEP